MPPATLLTLLVVAVMLGGGRPKEASRAVIYDPLHAEGDAFPAECVGILQGAGYEVAYIPGSEAGVAAFRDLPRCSLLVLRAHSSVFGGEAWLYTAEPYDTTRWVAEQLSGTLHIGRTGPAAGLVFTAGPRFVRASLKGRVAGATVVAMGCEGAETGELARAFVDAGASAFVAWDAPVTLAYSDEATLLFLRSLLGGGTAADACHSVNSSGREGNVFEASLTAYPGESG